MVQAKQNVKDPKLEAKDIAAATAMTDQSTSSLERKIALSALGMVFHFIQ